MEFQEIVSEAPVDLLLRNLSTPPQNWGILINEIDEKYKSSKIHLIKQSLLGISQKILSVEQAAQNHGTSSTDETSIKKILPILSKESIEHSRPELNFPSILEALRNKIALDGDSELFGHFLQLVKKLPKSEVSDEQTGFSSVELLRFVNYCVAENSISWFLLLYKLILQIWLDDSILQKDNFSEEILPIISELRNCHMIDEQDISELLEMLKQKDHIKTFESFPRISIISGSLSKSVRYELQGKAAGIMSGYEINHNRPFSYYEIQIKEKESKLKGLKIGWALRSITLNGNSNLGESDNSWVFDLETGKFLHSSSSRSKPESKHSRERDSGKQAFTEQLARSLSAKSFDLDQDEDMLGALFFEEENESGAKDIPLSNDRSESLLDRSVSPIPPSDEKLVAPDTLSLRKEHKPEENDSLLESTIPHTEIVKFSTISCAIVHETGQLLFYGDGHFLGQSPITIDLSKISLQQLAPAFSVGPNSKIDVNVGTSPFKQNNSVMHHLVHRFRDSQEKTILESLSQRVIRTSFTNSYLSFRNRVDSEENVESSSVLVQNVCSDSLKTFTLEFSGRVNQIDNREQIFFCCSPVLSGVVMSGAEVEEQACKIGFTSNLSMFIDLYGCERVKSSPLAVNDTWHHFGISYTFSRSSNKTTICIFLDGSSVFTQEIGSNKNNKPGKVHPRQLSLGGAMQNNQNGFCGDFTNVRLWSSARSTDKVLSALGRNQLTGTEQDLILFIPLEEGNGNIIKDFCSSRSSARKSEILTVRGSFQWNSFSFESGNSGSVQFLMNNNRNISMEKNVENFLYDSINGNAVLQIFQALSKKFMISTAKFLVHKEKPSLQKLLVRLPHSSGILVPDNLTFTLMRSVLHDIIRLKQIEKLSSDIFSVAYLTLLHLLESNIHALQFSSDVVIDPDTKAQIFFALLYMISYETEFISHRSLMLLETTFDFFFPDVQSVLRLIIVLLQLESGVNDPRVTPSLRRAISNSSFDKLLFIANNPVDSVAVLLSMTSHSRLLLLQKLSSTLSKSPYISRLISADLRPIRFDQSKGSILIRKDPDQAMGIRRPVVGAIVKRGPDWNYGDEDGGDGSYGVVLKIDVWAEELNKGVFVAWKTGLIEKYRFGVDVGLGKRVFDIEVLCGNEFEPPATLERPESTGDKKSLQYTPQEIFKALLTETETEILSKRAILTYIKDNAPHEWLEKMELLKPINSLLQKLKPLDICAIYRDFYANYALIPEKQAPLSFINCFSSSQAARKKSLVILFLSEALPRIHSSPALKSSILDLISSVQYHLFFGAENESITRIKNGFNIQWLDDELQSLNFKWDRMTGLLVHEENSVGLESHKEIKEDAAKIINLFNFDNQPAVESFQIRNRSRMIEMTLSGDREWNSVYSENAIEPNTGVYKWFMRTKFSERRSHFILGLATEELNYEEYLGQDSNSWGISHSLEFFHNGKKQSLSVNGSKVSSGSILEVTYDSDRGAFGLMEISSEGVNTLVDIEKCLLEDISSKRVFPAFSMFSHGDVLSILTDLNEVSAYRAKVLQTSVSSGRPMPKSSVNYNLGAPNELVIDYTSIFLSSLESVLSNEISNDYFKDNSQFMNLSLHLLGSLCRWTGPAMIKTNELKGLCLKLLELVNDKLPTVAIGEISSYLTHLSIYLILFLSRLIELLMQSHRIQSIHDIEWKGLSFKETNAALNQWTASAIFKNGFRPSNSQSGFDVWLQLLEVGDSRTDYFFRWISCFDRTPVHVRKIAGESIDKSVRMLMLCVLFHSGLLSVATKLRDLLTETVRRMGKIEGSLEEYFIKNLKPPAFLISIWESCIRIKSWARDELSTHHEYNSIDALSVRLQERIVFISKFAPAYEDLPLIYANSSDLLGLISQCNTEYKSFESVVSEVLNNVKGFVTNSLPIECLEKHSRNMVEAASHRISGLKLVQAILEQLSNLGTFPKIVLIDAILPFLHGTMINWTFGTHTTAKGSGGWHYTDNLSCANKTIKNELKGSFHSLFTLLVSEASLSAEADFYKLALLNALAIRISDADHELLVRVNFFFILKELLDENLQNTGKSNTAEKSILIAMKLLILMASQIATSSVDHELSFRAVNNTHFQKVRSGPSTLSDAVFDTLFKLLSDWGLNSSGEGSTHESFKVKVQTICTESATLLQSIARNEKCQRILCRKEWINLLLELIFFSDPLCRLRCIFILSDSLVTVSPQKISLQPSVILSNLKNFLPSDIGFADFQSISSAEQLLQLLLFYLGNLVTDSANRSSSIHGTVLFGITTELIYLLRKLMTTSWNEVLEKQIHLILSFYRSNAGNCNSTVKFMVVGILLVVGGPFNIPSVYSPVALRSNLALNIGVIKLLDEANDKCEIYLCKIKNISQIEFKPLSDDAERILVNPDALSLIPRVSLSKLVLSDRIVRSLFALINDVLTMGSSITETDKEEEKKEEIIIESKEESTEESKGEKQIYANNSPLFQSIFHVLLFRSCSEFVSFKPHMIGVDLELFQLLERAANFTNTRGLSDLTFYEEYLAAGLFSLFNVSTTTKDSPIPPVPLTTNNSLPAHSELKRGGFISRSRDEEDQDHDVGEIDPSLIESLASMGFPRKVCLAALQICGGDPSEALNYILANGTSGSDNTGDDNEESHEDNQPAESEWVIPSEERERQEEEEDNEMLVENEDERDEPENEEEGNKKEKNEDSPMMYHCQGSIRKFLPFYSEPSFESERVGSIFPGDDIGVLEEKIVNDLIWYKVNFSDFDGNNFHLTYGEEVYDIFVWVPKFVNGIEMVVSGCYEGDGEIDNESVDPVGDSYEIDRYYRVIGSNGALVRAGVEIASSEVASLNIGDIVHACEESVNSEGTLRLRLDSPICGWISKIFGLVEKISPEIGKAKIASLPVESADKSPATLFAPDLEELEKIDDNLEVLTGTDVFVRDDRFFGQHQGKEFKFSLGDESMNVQAIQSNRSQILGFKSVFQYFKSDFTCNSKDFTKLVTTLITLYSRRILLSYISHLFGSSSNSSELLSKLSQNEIFPAEKFYKFMRLNVFRGALPKHLFYSSVNHVCPEVRSTNFVENAFAKVLTGLLGSNEIVKTDLIGYLLNSVTQILTKACGVQYADHSWTDSTEVNEDNDEDTINLPNVKYASWASMLLLNSGHLPTFKKLVHVWIRALRGSSMSLKTIAFESLTQIVIQLRDLQELDCSEFLKYFSEIIPVRRLSRFASKRLWQELEDYPAFSRFIQAFISFIAETEISLRSWELQIDNTAKVSTHLSSGFSGLRTLALHRKDSYIQLFPPKDISGSWTLEITLKRQQLITQHYTPGPYNLEKDSNSSRDRPERRNGGEKMGLAKLIKLLLGTGGPPAEQPEQDKSDEKLEEKKEKRNLSLYPVYLLSSSKYHIKIQKGGRDFQNENIPDPSQEFDPISCEAYNVSFGQTGNDEKSFDCSIPYDEWVTLCLVCDTNLGTTTCYLNGKFVDVQQGVIPLPIATIGSTKPDFSFTGDISSFKVWPYAKTAKEILHRSDESSLINLKFDSGLNFGLYDLRGYLVTCKPHSCFVNELSASDAPLLSPSKRKSVPAHLIESLDVELTGVIQFPSFGTGGTFSKPVREVVSLRYGHLNEISEGVQSISGIFNWVEKGVQNYFMGELRNNQINVVIDADNYFSGPPEKLHWFHSITITGTIAHGSFSGICSSVILNEPSSGLNLGSLKVDKSNLSNDIAVTEVPKKQECSLELQKSAADGQYVVTFEVVANPRKEKQKLKVVDLTQYGMVKDSGSYWYDFLIKANSGNLAFGFCTSDALIHPDACVDANDGTWTYSTSGSASHGANLCLCDTAEDGAIISLQFNSTTGIIRFYKNYEILVEFTAVNGEKALNTEENERKCGIRPFVSLASPGDSVTYQGTKIGPVKISFPETDVEERNHLYVALANGSWKGYGLLNRKQKTEWWFGLWQNDAPQGIHLLLEDVTKSDIVFKAAMVFDESTPNGKLQEFNFEPEFLVQFSIECSKLRARFPELAVAQPVAQVEETTNTSNENPALPPTPINSVPSDSLNISLLDSSGETTSFSVEKDKLLKEIFAIYAKKFNVSVNSFVFKYNGTEIEETATINSLNLVEGAVIEVLVKSFTCPLKDFADPTETYFPNSDAPYIILIVYEAGATVRNGVEIEESLALRTLKQGEILEAFRKVNTNEGIGRFKIADGWVSEKLRGGSEAAVSLILREKFENAKKYRVIREDGAKVRADASLSSTEVGICPIETVLTITEKRLVQSLEADTSPTTRLKIVEPEEWRGWISDKSHLIQEIKDQEDPEIATELKRRNKIRQGRALKKQILNDLKVEPIYVRVTGSISMSKETFFLIRRSKNNEYVQYSEDFTTITTPESSGGRSLMLGTRGFSHGVHYWEVQINNASWGSVFIGVAPEDAGGWNGFGFINYRAIQAFGNETLYGSYFGVGDKIGVLLDMDRGTLSFFKDGEDFNLGKVTVINMGVAYHNIRKSTNRHSSSSILYPCFGMKGAGDSITILNSHWISEKGLDATNYLTNLVDCWEFLTHWKRTYQSNNHQLSSASYFIQYLSAPKSVSSLSSHSYDEMDHSSSAVTEERNEMLGEKNILSELYQQYQQKIQENEFFIESRPGIPLKIQSHLSNFYQLLGEEFVKEYNLFPGVVMNTVYGKGTILGISDERIWYSCERNYKKAWYWLANEFKEMLSTGKMTISYLDPQTIEFHQLPMLFKPTFSPPTTLIATESMELEKQSQEYQEIIHLSFINFQEIILSFFQVNKENDNNNNPVATKQWQLEEDIALIKYINQIALFLDINPFHLSIHHILYYYYSNTTTNATTTAQKKLMLLVFKKFSLKEIILRFLLLNYFNSSIQTILPFVDLSTADNLDSLMKIQNPLLSSAASNSSSNVLIANMKYLIFELKSLIYHSIKFDYWQSTVIETTAPTNAPPDEYERPDEIREISINRIQARDAIRRKDHLSFSEKLKISVFGQLMEQFQSWDARAFRRSYIHMQDAGQPRAFFVRFIGEGVDDQGGPYRAVFQSSIGEEIHENLLSLLMECANAKDEIGENRDKFIFNNISHEFSTDHFHNHQPSSNHHHHHHHNLFNGNNNHQNQNQMNSIGKLFIHLGRLIGIACRHKILLPLPFVPFIWKALVQDDIHTTDLQAVETSLINSLHQIPSYLQEMPGEQIYDLLIQGLLNCNTAQEIRILPLKAKEIVEHAMRKEGLSWTASSSDENDLHLPPPAPPHVVAADHHQPQQQQQQQEEGQGVYEYGVKDVIHLIEYYRLSSQNRLLQYFFEGLSHVLPVELFSLFTAEELERVFCGENTVDLDVLKKATEYESVTPSDKHIQDFWNALELLNTEERAQFINFCSGRSRLPPSASDFPMPFKLTAPPANSAKNPDDYLPIARTCFFSLSLPKYSSLEVCLAKLKYAIGNTELMDADFIDRRGTSGWENIQ